MAEPFQFQFTKGMEVEVFSDEKDLRGVLFTATVRSIPTKKNKILIQYQTLMADEIGSKPLREFVNLINIRPIPPREIDCVFRFSDEVDAYHNDGWWEGVVTKVLEGFRYLVYFRAGKEEIEFGRSELRIHREWVRGVWVPPLVDLVDLTEVDEKQDSGLNQSSGSNTTSQNVELPYTKHTTPPSNKFKTGESSLFRISRSRSRSIADDFSLSPLPSINEGYSQNNQVQSCKKLKKCEETESPCFRVPNSKTIRNFNPENLKCST